MPRQIASSAAHGEDGTASVELIAVVPCLLLAVLVAAQIAVAGYALWSASVATRAGARAALVGRDAGVSARRALPPAMRDGSRVAGSDAVTVEVPVPRLLPGLPRVRVSAETKLGHDGG